MYTLKIFSKNIYIRGENYMKNKLLIGFVFDLVLSISNVLAEESAEFVGIDAGW